MKKPKEKPTESKPQAKPEAHAQDILTDEEAENISGGIVSPRDPASGLPTGKRMHKPLVITKEL